MSNRYRHHKYTWTKPFGSERHHWELVGPDGAIHFHASGPYSHNDGEYACGLEIHYCSPPDYMRDHAPSHVNCPLTGGRCWHDGTSLYASETLWPVVRSYLRSGEHEAIFRILEGEADERFGYRPEGDDEAAALSGDAA
ncbi:hypothetical protein ACFOGJ_09020 [Marinibaculum pumilum]|uniref:Uncharacterized protein n=1 Tax=Marinibaculum pumilum TaxID=1766165 RepID=A0ABV7KZ17_9PROT